MFASTADRVPQNTDEAINEEIRRETESRIARLAHASSETISERLQELDEEWDIERTLELNAATAVLIGLGLGTMANRKFLALPALVGGFLIQHALQGWCPPLPVFRRLGIRTQSEIDEERYALKALRGDFEDISAAQGAIPAVRGALEAVRRS